MTVSARHLLARGDEISIDCGRLTIRPLSGRLIPSKWLQEHSKGLVREVLTTLKQDAYEYSSCKTGHYDRRKLPGLTLQLQSVVSADFAHVIFNVGLTRTRTTKSGKEGSPLPQGHFHIGERSHFYKFWQSTGLAIPKSLTSFHDYMGNLKSILFAAEFTEGRTDGRLEAGSIRPLSIPFDLVRQVFLPDSSRIASGYTSDNCRTTKPDKDSAAGYAVRTFQPVSTTRNTNYGKAVISERSHTGLSQHSHIPKSPQEQSVDEWTKDLCKPEE